MVQAARDVTERTMGADGGLIDSKKIYRIVPRASRIKADVSK
jgi:hypothetical protein